MKHYIGTEYGIFVKNQSVTLYNLNNRYPYSLSSLYIGYDDWEFYQLTKDEGKEFKEQALKNLILQGEIDRLNKITQQNFSLAK